MPHASRSRSPLHIKKPPKRDFRAFRSAFVTDESESDQNCRLNKTTVDGDTRSTLQGESHQTGLSVERIEELATRSDLLDRALVLTLPAIPDDKRRTEAELWGEFERKQPALLGALLDAVSSALRNEGRVHLDGFPRMADFAQWAVAAEPALGLQEGEFMRAYTGNREAAQ